MAETIGPLPFVCEWDDCQDRFRSLNELEGHVRRHIDDLQPRENKITETIEPSPYSQSADEGPRHEDDMTPYGGLVGGANTLQRGSLDDTNRVEGGLDQKCGTQCVVCQGGGEARGNYVVLCNGCNRPYHQSCHRPTIHDAVIRDRHYKWYCKRCTSSSISSANSSLHSATPSIKRK